MSTTTIYPTVCDKGGWTDPVSTSALASRDIMCPGREYDENYMYSHRENARKMQGINKIYKTNSSSRHATERMDRPGQKYA